jgi:YegS/Rv2252/BmrU family lipid kinase
MAAERYALIVNPSSGGGRARKVLAAAERELAARGMEHRVVLTESLEHGVEEAGTAAREGEIPVVISGDGLIGAVGGSLAGLDARMGVIPGGRGNDFARVTGIPTDTAAAVAVLAAGAETRVDVGEANGRRFLCIASCGFDSDANRIANESRFRGNLVYAWAGLLALKRWRHANFTVTIDGASREFQGFAVLVANGAAYGGGMLMAPDARLDDGVFDVLTEADVTKWEAVRNMPRVFKGTHIDQPKVAISRGSEVEISADRDFAVYADGEHITDLPAKLSVLPSALRLIAPSAA